MTPKRTDRGTEATPDVTSWGRQLRDLLVRGFTETEMDLLDAAASAANVSRNEWAKRELLRAALQPVVRRHYGLLGTADNGARIRIERYGDSDLDIEPEYANVTQEQQELCDQAIKLVERNDPGDREKAIGILQRAGFEVFEVPVAPPRTYALRVKESTETTGEEGPRG